MYIIFVFVFIFIVFDCIYIYIYIKIYCCFFLFFVDFFGGGFLSLRPELEAQKYPAVQG